MTLPLRSVLSIWPLTTLYFLYTACAPWLAATIIVHEEAWLRYYVTLLAKSEISSKYNPVPFTARPRLEPGAIASRKEIEPRGSIRGYTVCIIVVLSNNACNNNLFFVKIFRSHSRTDGVIADFCDVSLFQTHEFFRVYTDALQLIIYYDEVEICNPLGSRAGVHKLGKLIVCTPIAFKCVVVGLFYYTLGNLRPELRSILFDLFNL